MEEKVLNEKESLELIARMIRNSKKNLQLGNGNIFLLWGYLCTIISLVVYLIIKQTGNPVWNIVWLAIPLIGFPAAYFLRRKTESPVLTYTDKVKQDIWIVVGCYGMGFSLLACAIYNTLPMMPVLCVILCALTMNITGRVLKDQTTLIGSYLGILTGMAMLIVYKPFSYDLQYILFSLSFIFMMIIPGYHLNKEAKRLCSKN